MTQTIDGLPAQLAAPFDLAFLAPIGRVFHVFDQQDSGNLCFGVEDTQGARWFVKVAGARTVRAVASPQASIDRLLATLPVYAALAHPVLLGITSHGPCAGGYYAVSPWFDGLRMGKMYGEMGKILALPVEEKLAIFDAILQFHQHVQRLGYIAVDFYDGCVLYAPQTRQTRICDVEFYRPGPFINEMGRMWGSARYMAPEEHALGACIDMRTNVFTMGATAFQLLGGGLDHTRALWQASQAQYEAAVRATQPDPRARHATIDAFAEAWHVDIP